MKIDTSDDAGDREDARENDDDSSPIAQDIPTTDSMLEGDAEMMISWAQAFAQALDQRYGKKLEE